MYRLASVTYQEATSRAVAREVFYMSTDITMMKLGKSKMEKLQEGFVMTHKETGKEIIKNHGIDAFTMWWYIESLCFGKDKVFAFPKKETIAIDLGVSEPTVQRWIRKLEKIKAVKRVSVYNMRGSQSSNLLILNASFPEIPDNWDSFYQYGAYQIRKGEYVELESPEDKPWEIMKTMLKQIEKVEKTQENKGVQICTGHNNRVFKSEQGGCSNLHRGVGAINSRIPRDEGPFFEGEEEEVKKDLKDTYDEYRELDENKNSQQKKNKGFSFYNWLQ